MRIVHKVAAVCVKDDSLLLVKKAKGMWTTPGGKMELGESEEECLRREILEELNCHLEVIRSLGSWEKKANDRVFKLTAYLVSLVGDPVISDPELEEFRFVEKKEFAFIERAWMARGKRIPAMAVESLIPCLKEEKLLEW